MLSKMYSNIATRGYYLASRIYVTSGLIDLQMCINRQNGFVYICYIDLCIFIHTLPKEVSEMFNTLENTL